MKKNYSKFLVLIFATFLVFDSLSHHHHNYTAAKGIITHENFQDCNLCLFNNVNSNSYTGYKFNPHSYLDGYETYNKVYQLVSYNRSFDHSISLRGPPPTSL